jgi:hypothetical protein
LNVMQRTGLTTRHWLATLALTTSFWAAPAGAQMQSTPIDPAQSQPPMQNQHAPIPDPVPDRRGDLDRRQVEALGQFLQNHPEIAQQLEKNPELADNKDFIADHPEFRQFLTDHPEIREQLDQHPYAVMREEWRFEHRDDVTQRELAAMDRFLESHPEIAEQLEKSPRIIDDPKWVANHPALQAFLKDHPELRQQFDEHPWAFMQDEERYDRTHPGTGTDITPREVAVMNQFLDKHPEIAEQLQKDPKLIDDHKWVADHPALQTFLADHPEVRQQFDEHPYAFMRDEERYDQHHDTNGGMNNGELASFHQFLESHGAIANELSKNPSLATNQEYLENHAELQSYLKDNPQVNEELQQNPQSFVKSAQVSDTTAFRSTLPGSEKPK